MLWDVFVRVIYKLCFLFSGGNELKIPPRPMKVNKNVDFNVIPFIAGTSTSKSHNLGLKIQQAISLVRRTGACSLMMKTHDEDW